MNISITSLALSSTCPNEHDDVKRKNNVNMIKSKCLVCGNSESLTVFREARIANIGRSFNNSSANKQFLLK